MSNVTTLPGPAAQPVRGRIPKLLATLSERLENAVVRQDVAVDNLVADQEALAELCEEAAQRSADNLEAQRKALKEMGLA